MNVTEQHPEQVSPARDCVDDAFTKGVIKFHWNTSSMYRWNPYRSYLKLKVTIRGADANTQLTRRDGIGPNMFMGHCFWAQILAKCRDVVVSQINDYVPQVATLRERYNVSESRKQSLLSDMNFADSSLEDRIDRVVRDGYYSRDVQVRRFVDLSQTNGTRATQAQTISVVGGALQRLVYAGGGAINLTQTELEVGDWIILYQAANRGYMAQITAVNAGSLDMDAPMVAFGAEAIGPDKLYYVKNRDMRQTRQSKDFELIFRPCIGLFALDEWLGGDWSLELHPHTAAKMKKYVIEALTDVADAAYGVVVNDLQLYIWKGKTSSVVNGDKTYTFNEMRGQAQTITTNTLTNKSFVVHPKTHTLTMAIQKPDAGEDVRFPKTKFRCLDGDERKLQVWQLHMNGVTRPIPTPLVEIQDSKDYSAHYYYDNMIYLKNYYIDDPESLTEWLERGPYYSLVLRDDIKEASVNNVMITTQFRALSENPTLLLFDHYSHSFSLKYQNGVVTKVFTAVE